MAATIPTMQYGNLQPSFEVEAETHDAAMDLALKKIKELWDRTAEKPLIIDKTAPPPAPPPGEILRCKVSGTAVHFDPIRHIYTGPDGERWFGGSTFASRFKSKFAGELIAGKMAVKHGVDSREILAMWALNAEASSTLGTAVHAALQLYGEYRELSAKTKEGSVESALTKNPVLRPLVESFFETREGEKAFYEAFVADPVLKHCGLIDRLVIDDDGLWIEDYKTNADIQKSETILEPFKGVVPNTSLGAYWLQLSFYARILISHGRTIKGLRVHHWAGDHWDTHEHPVVDLTPALT
ncbi:PD-(D/E)XK nuclease family protein [Mycolicibacterium sp. S2-37]|uniref:PD-(D/E)XK nuclease family protein n=1 Tax=Mycolicibacterium sp. S2-37 TaxID=2810297 RepID=UPI001F5E75A5|nr:PD-(D/E)XK nuclease family protein [Mycolicibacterium sp. S2-37]